MRYTAPSAYWSLVIVKVQKALVIGHLSLKCETANKRWMSSVLLVRNVPAVGVDDTVSRAHIRNKENSGRHLPVLNSRSRSSRSSETSITCCARVTATYSSRISSSSSISRPSMVLNRKSFVTLTRFH